MKRKDWRLNTLHLASAEISKLIDELDRKSDGADEWIVRNCERKIRDAKRTQERIREYIKEVREGREA